MKERTRTLLRALGPAGLLGVLWSVAPAVAGIYLLARIGPAAEFLRDRELLGLGLYVLVFAVTAGFGLLPTYAQALVGGWAFGLAWGLPGALLGFVGGSLLGYLVARAVSRDRIEEVIEAHPKARVVRDALVGRGPLRTAGVVTLLRVPPNSPFALTNLAMAAAGVPVVAFAVGTALGMLPRTAVAVGLAAAAAGTGAEGLGDLVRNKLGVWWTIGGLGATVVVLLVLGRVANRALESLHPAPAADADPASAPPEPADR